MGAVLKYLAPYIAIVIVAVGLFFYGRGLGVHSCEIKNAHTQTVAAQVQTQTVIKEVHDHEVIIQKVRSLSTPELDKQLESCCLRHDDPADTVSSVSSTRAGHSHAK